MRSWNGLGEGSNSRDADGGGDDASGGACSDDRAEVVAAVVVVSPPSARKDLDRVGGDDSVSDPSVWGWDKAAGSREGGGPSIPPRLGGGAAAATSGAPLPADVPSGIGPLPPA